jgi:hypothetical protein
MKTQTIKGPQLGRPGYFAVILTQAGEFRHLHQASQARGWFPIQLWIFGLAVTDEEKALEKALMPMAASMEGTMVHAVTCASPAGTFAVPAGVQIHEYMDSEGNYQKIED